MNGAWILTMMAFLGVIVVVIAASITVKASERNIRIMNATSRSPAPKTEKPILSPAGNIQRTIKAWERVQD